MCDQSTMCIRAAALLGLLALMMPASTEAQSGIPAGPLTLDQVLELAEPQSEAMAIAREAVRSAEGEQVRARSGLLPQLSASAGYDRALASEFEGVFDTGTSGTECAPFTLNSQAAIDARVAEIERAIDCGAIGGGFFGGGSGEDGGGLEDLPFGRENTWRASLSFSQNLYSGGRLGAQARLAAAGHEAATLGVTTARAQLLLDVTQAYYDAVLSERLVAIAGATLEQSGATLRQVEAGFAAGAQPEFEVLRASVARDNQVPVLIRQRVSRDVAFLRLKQLLGLPADYDLRLADALGDEDLAPPPVFAERVTAVERVMRVDDPAAYTLQANVPVPDRTAVAQASTAVSLGDAALALAKAQRMPSASLTSTFSRVGYPTGILPSLGRTNWSIGASLTLPILTGGRQRGDESVASAELEQARLQRQQLEELAALDTRATWAELLAARAAWEASAGTVQQATRAYEIAEVRYGAGVSTQLELSDSRLLRQQAEANRAQAARDLQVARARAALLPDLPVTGVGAGGGVTGAAPTLLPAPQAPQPPQPQAASQFTNASLQGGAGQFQAGVR